MDTDQDKSITDSIQETVEAHEERRDFLKLATKYSAILAVLGVENAAFAGTPIQTAQATQRAPVQRDVRTAPARISPNQLQTVMDDAIRLGDVNRALAQNKHIAKNLNQEQKQALQSLSRSDLAALQRIQDKLATGHDPMPAVGIGIF